MRVFGTSGFRGYVNEKLSPLNVLKLALAFSSFLSGDRIAVGRDARLGNRVIHPIFVSGLLAGGSDVIDFGLTSTPALLHGMKGRSAGAAMITGSHTPPDIHGILLFRRDTAEIFGGEEREIEDIFKGERFQLAALDDLGEVEAEDALPSYREDVRREFPTLSGEIVLDSGHSPAVRDFLYVLNDLEIRVLNGEVRGDFPNRPPEPDRRSLELLGRIVREEGAMFGLSLDGDGDRAIFVDERGGIVPPDRLGILFALEEARSRGIRKVACPVNTTGAVEILREYGIEIVYTKVGPPAMAEAILEKGAGFAFEESGKYIWPGNILYGDPVYATAKLLQILDGEALSRSLSWIPERHTRKGAIPCPDPLKERLLLEIEALIEPVGDLIRIDGVKVLLDDGSWMLFRPSGTEPVFRYHVDAPTKERALELERKALSLIRSAGKAAGLENLN